MVLDTVKNILKIDWGKRRLENIPLHIALTINGIPRYSEINKKPIQESYDKAFQNLKDIFKTQIENKIRILTIYFMPKFRSSDQELIKASVKFMNELLKEKIIHDNQVKVSVLGKWYDLPNDLINPIKEIISETKDYDNFFINFCMNYSGRDEIVDSCKLIARKIKADKIDPEAISKDMIKENIYISYFVPPDMIIKTGIKRKLFGFLLWDTVHSDIYFAKKLFPDFTSHDFLKTVQSWKKDDDVKEYSNE
tara:strand:- start:927 stop:1679 length:753 start_codon:yes stop_codon:yes gene_type:complete